MPDWTYQTFLRHVLPKVPRRVLRVWGASRLGGLTIRFLGHTTRDPRLSGLADEDTRGIVSRLGVAATTSHGPGHAEPAAAISALETTGHAVLDLRRGGPGLPKRVSEATRVGMERRPSIGFLLLGLGMIVAGVAVALVAATRVVLPYDKAYVAVPADLLPFLAHDRMTLAGTMVAIGILYAALGWSAGATAWVRSAMIVSGTFGFASFFLFLAFGYFDPLHAAASAVLLPFFLWGAWTRRPHVPGPAVPDTRNDAAWRRAQWGTLGMVAVGSGLTVGGLTIAALGSTSVFVPSDLVFIGRHPTDPDLVSLAAHDRAGFGGALVSNGLLVLLTALWGIRRGASWLWWAYALAGTAGFGAAIGIHWGVGYTDLWHLLPVYFGAGLHIASLAALSSYMRWRPSRG